MISQHTNGYYGSLPNVPTSGGILSEAVTFDTNQQSTLKILKIHDQIIQIFFPLS